jgi:hypothetical protein
MTTDSKTYNPRVFIDVHVGAEPAGRLVLELFADKAPKATEKYESIP